jgi:hypothetical protein
MSEGIQRKARDRRDAAKRRDDKATQRARLNGKRGNPMLERLHKRNADLQASAAEAAERTRLANVEIEGKQLGEPAGGLDADLPAETG